MSVARISGPLLLDAPLRPAQQPVDVEAVGVGGHLRRDPGDQPRKRLGQRPIHPEDALEGREAHLHLLADWRAPVCLLGSQQHPAPGQFLSECPAAVGQIPKEPPGDADLLKSGLRQKLAHQEHVCGVCGGQLVGEGHAVGSTQQVQLHPVEGERSPLYPFRSLKTRRRLPHLARVQDLKKRLSFFTRRCKEEGCILTTPGNRCQKNLCASRRKDRSLSMPLSCWKSARVRTSESESLLSDSWLRRSGLSSVYVSSTRQNRMVIASSRDARVGVCCPWAIRVVPFAGDSEGPRFTAKPRNTHLEERGVLGSYTCMRRKSILSASTR